MRRQFRLIVGVAVIATILFGRAPAAAPRLAPADFIIDPARSEVRFTVTKLGFSDVTGTFRESSGEIRYDAATPAASSIRWRVRVASVLTDASSRDASLQQPEVLSRRAAPGARLREPARRGEAGRRPRGDRRHHDAWRDAIDHDRRARPSRASPAPSSKRTSR